MSTKKQAVTPPDDSNVIRIPQADPAIPAFAESQVEHAAALVVDSKDSHGYAQGFRAGIDDKIKELTARRMTITRPIDAAKAAVMDLFRSPIALLERVRGDTDRKILRYEQDLRRKAAELQAKLDAKAKQEREAMAAKAEKARTPEKAAALIEASRQIVAPTVTPDLAVTTGRRKSYGYRIKDASLVPRAYLCVDEKRVGAHVRAMGMDAQATFGDAIEVFETTSVTA